MSEVAKEFVIAGCKVTLRFQRSPKDHWMVEGTVSSGEQDHKRMTSFKIHGAAGRDAAESLALKKAGELIGNNVPAVEDRKDPVTASPKVPPDTTWHRSHSRPAREISSPSRNVVNTTFVLIKLDTTLR